MASPALPTVAAAAVVVAVAAAEVASVVAARFLEVAVPVQVAALAEAPPVRAAGPREELRLAVAVQARVLACPLPTMSARPNLLGPRKRTATRAPESVLAAA